MNNREIRNELKRSDEDYYITKVPGNLAKSIMVETIIGDIRYKLRNSVLM